MCNAASQNSRSMSIAQGEQAAGTRLPADRSCSSTVARLIRSHTRCPSISPRSSIASTMRAASSSASTPCLSINRLAARQMSRSEIRHYRYHAICRSRTASATGRFEVVRETDRRCWTESVAAPDCRNRCWGTLSATARLPRGWPGQRAFPAAGAVRSRGCSSRRSTSHEGNSRRDGSDRTSSNCAIVERTQFP